MSDQRAFVLLTDPASLPSTGGACASSREPGFLGSRPLAAAADPTADVISITRHVLLERGHEFAAEPAPPFQVDVTKRGTALIAVLHFPGGRSRRVVVKSTGPNVGIRSAPELARVLRSLAASSPSLANSLPPILGSDEHAQLLVLGYVDGESLGQTMTLALKREGSASEHGAHFQHAAIALARTHELAANRFMACSQPAPSNATFVEHLKELVAPFASVFAKAGFDPASRLLERMTPEFFARLPDRVFLIDVRPKNLIVRPSGDVCFVDLDCAAGAPGMAVANFLVALDRFGSRYPGSRCQTRINTWKRIFVEAYAGYSGEFIGEDLTFFYPRSLLHMLGDHRATRAPFTPYLHWYYRRHLKRFLSTLSRFSPAEVSKTPALLFSE